MQSTQERWLPIPGHEGRYDVSDLGRVRSWVHWNNGPAPRFLKASNDGAGYQMVRLNRETGQPQICWPIHSLVLLAFVGPMSGEMCRRHFDGDRMNNTLTNLSYGTSSENAHDRVRHGTDAGARKTHCKQGHPFNEANTTRSSRGSRVCRTCHRDASRATRARQRAMNPLES